MSNEPPATVIAMVRAEHERAVGANAMFDCEHWKHNAGSDWPHEPDDDSYSAFENCIHPSCRWARECQVKVADAHPEEPQE